MAMQLVVTQEEPALLAGFAARCVRSERLPLFSPLSLQSLASFERHRATVVDVACREPQRGCFSGEEHARQSVALKFGDFVDFFCASHTGAAHWLSAVEGLEFYLCQCPIAVLRPDATCSEPALPRIMDDFVLPEDLSSEALSQVNLWMAARPSRTGLHYDAYRNVLVVLHGRKTVTLYAPSESGNLYPHPVHSKSANHSRVDVSDPDMMAHPKFANAASQRFVVDAGDALFIPEGWWHQVDSDASTIAVNFWFDGLQKHLATQVPKAMAPYCLRVLLQDEVKRGGEQYRTAEHQEREQTLIAASAVGGSVFQSVQRKLAAEYPSEWATLLENASEDFVALLTESWDRAPAVTCDGEECTSTEQLLETLFSALSNEDGERIRGALLNKQSAFETKVCAQVVADTFGLQVLP
ncbi:hypothetical protein PybrP1_009569 [[Pythium] brassicae (nom. inval.)]|nr:hypothetical protein PybrP1_009569 [[Pythium] brassicae (nom. inval.)]